MDATTRHEPWKDILLFSGILDINDNIQFGEVFVMKFNVTYKLRRTSKSLFQCVKNARSQIASVKHNLYTTMIVSSYDEKNLWDSIYAVRSHIAVGTLQVRHTYKSAPIPSWCIEV